MSQKVKTWFSQHYLAVVVACIVGTIYIAPHIWFMLSNPGIYQGIPLMQVDNEDFYLARMQEIIDGHPLLGSVAFFEYKNQPPISPPTVEWLYVLPTVLLGVSLVAAVTASKFVLPALLFVLVYLLIYNLLGQENKLANKLSALAGALFVTLGYDLISYQYVFRLLTGAVEPSRWLIWTRPVNPTIGAIFLFSFLLFFWSVVQRNKGSKIVVIGAGVFLGLMFCSYFFSWGLALSILALAGLFYLLKRDWLAVKRITLVLVLGLLISLPYWYLTWQAKSSLWYDSTLLRSGLFYTHYPLINKVLVVILIIYLAFLVFKYFKNFSLVNLKNSEIFILALLAGGLFAYNQQVITGLTVWPFHFVQFTIPLAIVTLVVVLHSVFYARWKFVWASSLVLITLASLWFGLYTQSATYAKSLEQNQSVQSYAAVFDWFNSQPKDCVVLTVGNAAEFKFLSGAILAFTHCNQYSSTWSYSLMPYERLLHSLLVNLRFREVTTEGLDDYLVANPAEARIYLFSNWVGLYNNVTAFPDFQDLELSKRLEQLPADYEKFLQQNLETELNKYRLDFIVSFNPLPQNILDQLPNLKFQQEINSLFIYQY